MFVLYFYKKAKKEVREHSLISLPLTMLQISEVTGLFLCVFCHAKMFRILLMVSLLSLDDA